MVNDASVLTRVSEWKSCWHISHQNSEKLTLQTQIDFQVFLKRRLTKFLFFKNLTVTFIAKILNKWIVKKEKYEKFIPFQFLHRQLARIISTSCLSKVNDTLVIRSSMPTLDLFFRSCNKDSQLTWTQNDNYSMNAKDKSHTKCSDKCSNGSLLALVISILLAILLFVRIELVHRKSEATVAQLAFRIQRIEEEIQDKIQNRIMEILQSNVMPASKEKKAMNFLNSCKLQKLLNTLLDILKALHMKMKNRKHNSWFT